MYNCDAKINYHFYSVNKKTKRDKFSGDCLIIIIIF